MKGGTAFICLELCFDTKYPYHIIDKMYMTCYLILSIQTPKKDKMGHHSFVRQVVPDQFSGSECPVYDLSHGLPSSRIKIKAWNIGLERYNI